MRRASGLVAAAALLVPAQLTAQNGAAAPASERRLTPEQIEAVLAEAAKKREAAEARVPLAPDSDDEQLPRRQVHGEVGVAIGTGGYRELFGTAIYPMGDDGVAAISLDFVDLGKRRYRR